MEKIRVAIQSMLSTSYVHLTVFSQSDTVLVKPNCIVAENPSTGITTDSVLEGVVDSLRCKGVEEIVIGEGGNPETDKAFEVTGLRELFERKGFRLVNLNDDEGVEVRI